VLLLVYWWRRQHFNCALKAIQFLSEDADIRCLPLVANQTFHFSAKRDCCSAKQFCEVRLSELARGVAIGIIEHHRQTVQRGHPLAIA